MRTARAFRLGALALGIVLFAGTLAYVDLRTAARTLAGLGIALPLALLFSALWHLLRTIAWALCFPSGPRVPFAQLVHVRLAAEAFSYLTLRGIAGEPLKVVLLAGTVDARRATAAVALERIAYLVGTTLLVGVASVVALVVLPLTPVWFRIFRAFAIASGVIALFTLAVVAGRGTYLHSLLSGIDRTRGSSLATGRVGGFVVSVERQMLDLVRGNPARLLALMGATVAAYACMVLEAWVILRATRVPVSLNDAVAVETFSRVASFASSFIPANIGALEASSVAAASAVGATGAGAALALVRRLRGLLWAGIGLAIYPRHGGGDAKAIREGSSPHVPPPGATLLYLPVDPGVKVPATTRVFGLPIAERVLRAAKRAGYGRVLVWLPEGSDPPLEAVLRRTREADVVTSAADWTRELEALGPDTVVTVIGAGTVVSPALLESASRLPVSRGGAVDVPAGVDWPESGVLRMRAADCVDRRAARATLAERRRRARPLPAGEDVAHGAGRLALRIVTPQDLPGAERTIRRSSYKDTDSKVARFNRRISLPISASLIRTPLTANQLSVALVALGFYAGWLFSLGHYWTGVLGAFLSLAASVLDGCDGEIARLKYQESALGCWIETVGDYSYYVAIFIGLTVGSVRQTGVEAFYWIGTIALAGTLITFALLIFLRSRITAGQPERLHTIARQRMKADPTGWARLTWKLSFVATRAAMPYGIMAFALVNLLPGIVILAAAGANVYWISLVVKLRDLIGGEQRQRLWPIANP